MRLFSPRVLAVLWTTFILVGLTLPGSTFPQSRLLEFDKLVHLVLFMVLALLWLPALSRGRFDRGLAILSMLVAFSILTEIYQGLLPFGRQADMLDAAADAVGALVGFVVWLIARRPLSNWEERTRRETVEKL